MLKDIISIASGFQSSVNIEYDFNDESKISGFIPTSSALSVINSILENTDNGCIERAKILTGAYGRGKSHSLLMIAIPNGWINSKSLSKGFVNSTPRVLRESKTTYPVKKGYCLLSSTETAAISHTRFYRHYSRHCIIMS